MAKSFCSNGSSSAGLHELLWLPSKAGFPHHISTGVSALCLLRCHFLTEAGNLQNITFLCWFLFLAVLLEEPVTAMTLEEAIKVIQVAERARQGRARAAFMKRIYLEEKRQSKKEEKETGKSPDDAATCIQKVSFLCSNNSCKAKWQCFGQESSCRQKHSSHDGKLSEIILFRVSSKVKYII